MVFLRLIASVLVVLLLPIVCPAAERPALPNIFLMMADDMGLGDTSAYLGVRLDPDAPPIARTLRTPNLEAFRKDARLFTDAHAAASMCSSTRYSLLTGRFAHRSYLKYQGWLPHGPNPPMIQRSLTTLPEMLQQRGYHTGIIGKYHVGIHCSDAGGQPSVSFDFSDVDFTKPLLDGPTHHGFDEFFGTDPRVYLRNDRWTFQDRSQMKLLGMHRRKGRILAAPDWDLAQIGPIYLREARKFLQARAAEKKPFFLYYVPNANHQQLHPGGRYAVPAEIDGEAVAGACVDTEGEPGGDRADMVLENDIAFGKLLKLLCETEDPRWPGHTLIENTLVIFTSDNGPNEGNQAAPSEQAGGLRGKKARIWEGGLRVPMLVSWPGRVEAGSVGRSVMSLSDLYATLARVVGHELGPDEAQDSFDVFDYWTGAAVADDVDERPRVFFCHLGPPFANDCLAIRSGRHKLLVAGGFAQPWTPRGARGTARPVAYYDLGENLFEEDPLVAEGGVDAKTKGGLPHVEFPPVANDLAARLLHIHNRGHARPLHSATGAAGAAGDGGAMIRHPGTHNLRNDVTGEIGMVFRLRSAKTVTHLGLWDDHDRDRPVRSARSVPRDRDSDRAAISGASGDKKRGLAAAHVVRLLRFEDRAELARAELAGAKGLLEAGFRYAKIEPTALAADTSYLLLMSTESGDGDLWHDPASFDGLSALLHPDVQVERSVMLKKERVQAIPAFADLHADYEAFRLPVGPGLKFEK